MSVANNRRPRGAPAIEASLPAAEIHTVDAAFAHAAGQTDQADAHRRRLDWAPRSRSSPSTCRRWLGDPLYQSLKLRLMGRWAG